ncbi:MAG: triose-phosphate isomerase [Calditrichaeota bacterium]|nr:MAG: triose-phosphate isomerase [Calditrichota bacterium]
MRVMMIAGNWKMHKTNSEALQLANQIKIKTTSVVQTEIVICPPYTALSEVGNVIKDSRVQLGAQNMFWEARGAFTGEISAGMLKSCGVSHVILGHSERRQYFGETDQTVNKRLLAVLENDLHAIVCVGETLEEREAGQVMDVISRQINGAFRGVAASSFASIVIAYEPVWAIGTGKTATPEQAQEVHAAIRGMIEKSHGEAVARACRILYGGSVKPANAQALLQQADIDGALVGGACLQAETFVPIIQTAETLVG